MFNGTPGLQCARGEVVNMDAGDCLSACTSASSKFVNRESYPSSQPCFGSADVGSMGEYPESCTLGELSAGDSRVRAVQVCKYPMRRKYNPVSKTDPSVHGGSGRRLRNREVGCGDGSAELIVTGIVECSRAEADPTDIAMSQHRAAFTQ